MRPRPLVLAAVIGVIAAFATSPASKLHAQLAPATIAREKCIATLTGSSAVSGGGMVDNSGAFHPTLTYTVSFTCNADRPAGYGTECGICVYAVTESAANNYASANPLFASSLQACNSTNQITFTTTGPGIRQNGNYVLSVSFASQTPGAAGGACQNPGLGYYSYTLQSGFTVAGY